MNAKDWRTKLKADLPSGQARILVPLSLLVLLVLGAAGLAYYGYLERTIVDSFGREAEATASVVADLVEHRMGEYRELRTAADEAKPFYRDMKSLFQRMRGSGLFRFIYTERRVSEREIEYVLDSEDRASLEASPIGQRDQLDALGAEAFAGGKSVHGGLVKDPRWGVLITGYAPIFDPASGSLVGLAGVDIEARTIDQLLSHALALVLLIAAFIFAAALVPILRLSSTIARQLEIDALTETKVKRSIMPDLERAVARASAAGQPLAVLVLDLDRFKGVNDEFGHQAGDLVLKAAAKAMQAALRYDDKLYRYGGEEFVLIMAGPPETRAMQVADLMRRGVESTSIPIGGGRDIRITVSVGVACLGSGEKAESLLGRADEAMYESKREGRNRVTMGRREGGAGQA